MFRAMPTTLISFLVLFAGGSGAAAEGQAKPGTSEKAPPIPIDHSDVAPGQEVFALAFSPDGRIVAAGDKAGNIILTDVASGKTLRTFAVKDKGWAISVAFSPDGKELSAGVGATLNRWKLPTGELLPSPPVSKNHGVKYLQYTSDSRRLIGLVDGVFLAVWDLDERKERVSMEMVFRDQRAADLRVAADGKSALVIPSFGGDVVKVDLANFKELSRTQGLAATFGHALSAGGEYAILSKDLIDGQVLYVWNLTKDREFELALGLEGLVRACFSDDGKLVAAGFMDGTVRIWDRARRLQIASFKAHSTLVNVLALPQGGQALASAGLKKGDGTLWSLPRVLDQKAVKSLPEDPPAKKEKKVPTPLDPMHVELAGKARKIFETYCYRCHGQDGAAEGGLNYLLDHDRLVGGRQVVAGSVTKSRLLKRVLVGEMPPEEEKSRPTTDEIAVLRKWVETGAPAWAKSGKQRPFVTLAEVERLIHEDYQKVAAEDRQFQAYFTLAPLANAAQSEDELQTVRLALSRVLNLVSTGPNVVPPQSVDAAKLLLRVDLRDYGQWMPGLFRSSLHNPYGIRTREVDHLDPMPIRADWFIYAASRPPHYHTLLGIPWTAKQLEDRLKVKSADNIKEFKVLRAGFNGSGISRSNRIIERHEAADGYYWKSYDFAASDGRKNIFAFPLGPTPGPKSFHSDGGEIIFRLPNGLQGYMLTDGRGNRLDKGPTSIVSDPKHPERVVENGVSCMSCHSGGLIDKGDQIRAHAEKNLAAFNETDRKVILGLYAPRDKFSAALAADAQRFRAASKKAGGKAGGAEPVVVAALRYETELDVRQVAAEAWLSTEEFLERLDDFPSLVPTLGVLRTPGGTVQRKVFQRAFPMIIQNLRVGEFVSGWGDDTVGSLTPRPVTVHSGAGLAPKSFALFESKKPSSVWTPTVIDPTFSWIAAIDGNNLVRVFDAATGKPAGAIALRYPDTVSAMTFSTDGSLIAIAGHDGQVRIWELESGKRIAETPRPKGQSAILTLAFSPDGKRLASTGTEYCHANVWEVQTGKRKENFLAYHSTVSVLAFAPDNRTLLIGGKTLIVVWDLVAGKKRGILTGHPGNVHAIAVSPDGAHVVTAGTDGEIRFWDLKSCEQIGAEKLQTGKDVSIIRAVAFSKDGKHLATAHEDGCVTLWDADGFRPRFTFRAMASSALRGITFSPDGSRLATTQPGAIRVWEVRTLLKAADESP
jgi:WD40 repeat protein/mono/diheme cytochrome c family protein